LRWTIPRGVVDDIVVHARGAAPAECCGILVGRAGAILASSRAANIAEDPVHRFLLDPADHFRARRSARERSLDVVGFYHSHVHVSARPSPTDLAEASYDGHAYLIVSLAAEPPEIALFELEAGNFREVPLVTEA
jgi:proteasome lid subunit RPN8/RPN11